MCSADVSGILEAHPELMYRLESVSDAPDVARNLMLSSRRAPRK